MSRERSRRTIRRDGPSWQRRVWARIALDGLRRPGWRHGAASNIVVPLGGNMSDGPHRKPAVPLERPGRLRPPWLRRLGWLAMVVCLCAAIIGRRSDVSLIDREDDCAAAVHHGRTDAAQVCQLEYRRTQDPTTGVHLAEALNKEGDRANAKRFASQLLTTPARSDALQLLGWIALVETRLDDAVTALETARQLHRAQDRSRELAIDDAMLASVRTQRSLFVEALRLLDECITFADDASTKFYCHTIAARTLIKLGYLLAAEKEIESATSLATNDEARINLEYQRGNLEQESGHHALAITRFKKVLLQSERSPNVTRILNTELNLAYSLAEQGKVDKAQIAEAKLHLKNATLLDSDHEKEKERTWVAAQIAYRQGDLPTAASLTEQYFELLDPDDSVDRDDRIDVATLRARIELERGDLERAERFARRGVEQAERVRSTQSTIEVRPWVLEKRRTPYELLFTALARSGQVEAAAMAFDEWQGRTVQDALARPRPPALLDYRGMADQITRLGEWLRVASRAAFARSPDREAVLHTMQGIDLLALIVADGDVWSLTASHGPLHLSKIGSLTEIQDLVDQFRGHPTCVELGSRLGALLLPDDAFRETREVLHVLVDGKLKGLPVAALRRGASPLIAMRPIVRVLRLPETRCVHVTRSGHATVLGAPDAKIPNARTEAEQVAELLHTTSQTGAAATKDALFAAKNDAVLHVAAHGMVGMDGAAIVLADGEVSALEISARQLAPSLAVLTACDAATSEDSELAGSLASGFLGAGSQHVVATLRPISDTGALEISTRFYRAGGVADPARALATVQAELAKTSNTDWPNIAVFGPDVCSEDAPAP